MKRIMLLIVILTMILPVLIAADTEEDYHWGAGISAIAPGLPVAAKVVYQNEKWGWQGELNYFYLLGMARIDGRRILKEITKANVYAFAGLTLNHFNHYDEVPSYLEFILSADFGVGAEWRFTKRMSLGIEGGLLVPFWCNKGLDQFDNSGLMVANIYLLYWF